MWPTLVETVVVHLCTILDNHPFLNVLSLLLVLISRSFHSLTHIHTRPHKWSWCPIIQTRILIFLWLVRGRFSHAHQLHSQPIPTTSTSPWKITLILFLCQHSLILIHNRLCIFLSHLPAYPFLISINTIPSLRHSLPLFLPCAYIPSLARILGYVHVPPSTSS